MKLICEELHVEDLKDTGSTFPRDAQDPALCIKVGNSRKITERKVDAGCKADFSEKFEFEITQEEYNKLPMEVEVLNVGEGMTAWKKISVGKASVQLTTLLPKLNERKEVKINLLYNNKEQKGVVTMKCILMESNNEKPSAVTAPTKPAGAEKQPDSKKPADSKNDAAAAAPAKPTGNEKNVNPADAKKPADSKQDPLESQKPGAAVVPTKPAGNEKDVNPADAKKPADSKQDPLESQKPGAAAVPTKPAASEKNVNPADSKTPKDSKQESTDSQKPNNAAPTKASSDPKIQENPKSKTPEIVTSSSNKPPSKLLEIDDKTATLKLTLSSFEAHDLFDTGSSWDKQDPQLKVTVGKQPFFTKRKQDAGTEATFPETFEFTFPVTDYDKGIEAKFEMINKHASGVLMCDKPIGTGVKKVKGLFPQLNISTPIQIDLIHDKTAKGYVSCSVTATLIPAKTPLNVPPTSQKVGVQSESVQEKSTETAVPVEKSDGKSSVLNPASSAKGSSALTFPDKKTKLKLIVTSIEAHDLVNAASGKQKQNPIVQFSIEKRSFSTQKFTGLSYDAFFTESFELPFLAEEYENGVKIEVEVLDEQSSALLSFGHNRTKIGSGGESIKKLFPVLLQPIEVKIPLEYTHDNQTISKGQVQFVGFLTFDESKNIPPPPQNIINIPKELQTSVLTLTLSRLQAHSLPDHGWKVLDFTIDAQDPLLILTVGGKKEETKRQKDAGKNALFPEIFTYQISAEDVLKDLKIEAAVVNESVLGQKTPIAEGSVLVKDVIANINKPNYVKIDLEFKGKPAGYVLVQANLAVTPTTKPVPNKLPSKEAPEKPPGKVDSGKADSSAKDLTAKLAASKYNVADFRSGELRITKIICQDLTNVERFGGKNDPYVVLNIGSKRYKTDAIEEAGANATFPLLNYVWELNSSADLDGELCIAVSDRNSHLPDELIGTAVCKLSALADHINEDNLEIPLTIYDKNRKESGKIILYLKIVPNEEIQKALVPKEMVESFLKDFEDGGGGELHLISAKCEEVITKGEKLSFQAEFGNNEWHYQSTILDFNSSSVHLPMFDHLEQVIPITRQHFDSEAKFTVHLHHQTILGSLLGEKIGGGLLGTGSAPITQLLSSKDALQEEESTITIDLVTEKGSKIGRIIFTVQLLKKSTVEKINELILPKEFLKGNLKITKIEGNGLKNVEYLGKQDPYVILKDPDPNKKWIMQTKSQTDAGIECLWNDLEFLYPEVTKEQLMADQKLIVEVHDAAKMMSSDKLIGSAEMSMKQAARSLKNEVPITVMLQDKDHKIAGRLTLYATLLPIEPKELPKNIPSVYLELIKIVGEGFDKLGSLFSSSHPQIEIKYDGFSSPEEKFSFVTPPHPEEKNNPVWDHLLITSKDFPSGNCLKIPLTINLIQDKKPLATATIDNLKDAFLNIREEYTYSVDFIDATAKKNNLGKATLYCRIVPSTERKETINATITKFIERPINFEIGELCITKIIVQNLKNTEWIGKSDPFVLLRYNEWIGQTEVLKNAGGDVIYDKLDFHMEVDAKKFQETQKEIADASAAAAAAGGSGKDGSKAPPVEEDHRNDVTIEVFDKNEILKNVLVGQAYFPLARYVYNANQEVRVDQTIYDQKTKKPVGQISIFGELKKIDPSSLKELPKTFKTGLVTISKISTFELKNRKWIGKQDPFVIVKLNDKIIDQTPVIQDGGSDCVFDSLEMRFLVTKEAIKDGILTCEVYEKENIAGQKVIGNGKTNLHVIRELEKEYQLPIRLIDDNGNYCGRLLVFLQMMDGANIDENTLSEKGEDTLKKPLPKEFNKGTFSIEKVVASHLKGAGSNWIPLLQGQNPFVEVQLAGWNDSTIPFHDVKQPDNMKFAGGKDCIWDLVDLSTVIDRALIEKSEELTVTVRNKSGFSAVHEVIGTGKTSIIKTANHLNDLVKLDVPLYDPKIPTQKAGKITLYARLAILDTDELDDSSIQIPPDFECGILKISSIECYHLKNTELGGDKQDPYVILQLGNILKEQTQTQNNAGDQAKWEHLPYECEVYLKNVLEDSLQITVKDSNTLRPDALIGKASISLKRNIKHLNEEITLTLTLQDEKQKISGKCKIYCSVHLPEPEEEIKLPDTIDSANVKIKRVSLFDLKNNAFFGFIQKADPFVNIHYGEKNFTKTLKNINGTMEASSLDCDILCDSKALRVGEVSFEVFSGGIRKSVSLGKGHVLIKDFYDPQEKDKEKICNIISAENQIAGRLTIQGQIVVEKKFVAPTLDLPKDFTMGLILITKVEASHLKNTELFGKQQDPYCRITIGDWSETTPTLNNAGSNPIWPSLTMAAEVNRDILAHEELVLQFYDQNFSRSDQPLGAGAISIRSLCNRINQPTELSIDIIDDNKAIISNAKIIATLVKGDEKDALEGLPESVVKVEKGVLQITDITGYDLRGSDYKFLGDKQDIYCMVEIKEVWKNQTVKVKNVTRTCSWNNLSDLLCPVTKDILKFKRLSVTIMDSGTVATLTGGGLLGSGDMSLRKIGEAYDQLDTYTIRLKDKRGGNAGRVEIKAIVHPAIAEPEVVASKVGGSGTAVASSSSTGRLQIMKLSYTELKAGTNNIYAVASIATWSKLFPVIAQAGMENSWNNVNFETDRFAMNHVEKAGLKVEFFKKATTISLLSGKDTSIGVADFPVLLATQKPNTVVSIPTQIKLNGAYAGKCMIDARFITDETLSIGDVSVGGGAAAGKKAGPGSGDTDEPELKQSHQALQFKVTQLEKQLKLQMHQEILDEKNALLEKMKSQHDELSNMLQEALKKLKKQEKNEKLAAVAPPRPAEPTEEMPEITDVHLPKNISRWRTAHAQAWLAFQLGLPQYIETFAEASVDGLLLLKYLDYKHLKEDMKIDNEVHRNKIIFGIQALKDQQAKYEQHLQQRRKEKEEERKRRLQREEEDRKKREAKEGKKKGKKSKHQTQPVMSKPDFIDNGINRVKLEKAIKESNELLHAKQKKRSQQNQRYNKTWQFEYSGKPKPPDEEEEDPIQGIPTLWNSLDRYHANKKPEIGTKTYQKIMRQSILPDVTPVQKEIREIPKTCSTDDVIAIMKGAMFEVSNWLLKLEEMNYKKNALLDEDLDEFVEEIDMLPADQEGTGEYRASEGEEEEDGPQTGKSTAKKGETSFSSYGGNDDDDEEIPPTYSHFLEETISISLPHVEQEKKTNKMIADIDEDDEPPPAYEEALHSKDIVIDAINLSPPLTKDHSTASLLPAPTFEIPPPHNPTSTNKTTTQPQPQPMKSRKRKQLTELLLQSQQYNNTTNNNTNNPPPYETDRMKLIYNALVNQTNNRAHWLGGNQKLTRLKLEGGLESLLKLKLSWEQFDMLWTRLDYQRSGDIDCNEFIKFFGNLNEFLHHEGMNHLTLGRSLQLAGAGGGGGGGIQDEEMKILIEYLYLMVDTLRKTHFTILEIFNSFDRNGSGDISIAEFHSLLKLILGPGVENNKKFDRKLVYRVLNVLDVDGDKSISLSELLFFIYRIWKTQLQDLANEISQLSMEQANNNNAAITNGRGGGGGGPETKANNKRKELIQSLLQEREEIKTAIKRNFPRHWRDKLEQLGMETNTIPGPFTYLLNQMHIITEESADPNFTSLNARKAPLSVDTIKNDDFTNFFGNQHHDQQQQPPHQGFGTQTIAPPPAQLQIPSSPPRPSDANYFSSSSPTKRPGRTYLSGHNSLLRFKIRMPAGQAPVRTTTQNHEPMRLTVPRVVSLNNNPNMMTGETTSKVLNDFDYMAGMMH